MSETRFEDTRGEDLILNTAGILTGPTFYNTDFLFKGVLYSDMNSLERRYAYLSS